MYRDEQRPIFGPQPSTTIKAHGEFDAPLCHMSTFSLGGRQAYRHRQVSATPVVCRC